MVIDDTDLAIVSVSISDQDDDDEPDLLNESDIEPGKQKWIQIDDTEQPGACFFTVRIKFSDGRVAKDEVNVCHVHISRANDYLDEPQPASR